MGQWQVPIDSQSTRKGGARLPAGKEEKPEKKGLSGEREPKD